MHVTPAYGRDYKSRKAVEEDLLADKDFIIADVSNRYDGKPINFSQMVEDNIKVVSIRYNKLKKVAVYNITAKKWVSGYG